MFLEQNHGQPFEPPKPDVSVPLQMDVGMSTSRPLPAPGARDVSR